MDKVSALGLLGLEGNLGEREIRAAVARKKEDLASKQASAPTESLKAKFASLLAKLDEAESVLLGQAPGASNPAQAGSRSSPLSQTKLADLPQGQQSYTGFDSGDSGARIHLQRGHKLANRYEIREQIGAGGMGAVYHAFDHTKQEDIALKVLLPALMQNERARQRFLDEARISARLSHPNIVNVHDVQQDGDFFFLTMELLHGQDLRQLMEARQLSRQPFDESEARTLASTLAGALAYAHQHTVHRDIKPENIWVTEEGDYKIMDFGIARVQSTSQRTQTGAAMGTAYYMAPEQLKGTSSIDSRADQYALGVLLYELLSGDVPAGRFKPLRELRKDISKGFAAAVEKSLETRAEDRFADMKAFADALQSKSGGGISLPSLPWEKIGIAAAVLVAVLGLGVVVSSSGGLSSLIPMSAEEKAQREAQLARLQGEIKVLKQRLEVSRRDLDSDIRDAERNKSSQLKALQEWQRLTETGIFNGSKLGELEGILSMGEALLRKEQYSPAAISFSEAKSGYEKLNEEFQAGSEIYMAEQLAMKARGDWHKYVKSYGLVGEVASAEEAERAYDAARKHGDAGELVESLSLYRQAEAGWREAPSDMSVADKVAQVDGAREENERRRREGVIAAAVSGIVSSLKDVPSGSFNMGGDAHGAKPIHSVTVPAFRMMEHEVTFAQWDACIMAGACNHRPSDEGWGRGSRPVFGVSWNDVVQQFIPWLNKASGKKFRLPSEAEWEYAARAGGTTDYSWGNVITCNQARYGRYNSGGYCGNSKDGTLPVKSFSPNRFGLYDMHGNVSEWVQDCWNENYQQAPSNGGAWLTGQCKNRVNRGGFWMSDPNFIKTFFRNSTAASARYSYQGNGFRLAE
jgi:formylglycine-generating enzyme required for sulfatase activity/serine/threonine protein kinase